MGLFKKKTVTKTYDKENKKPVIKASICNGEQVAGFIENWGVKYWSKTPEFLQYVKKHS